MADDPNFSEPPLTARERALQEKIIRLEKRLEGYQSQIGTLSSDLILTLAKCEQTSLRNCIK